jgi:type I restriction enzyme S subunit
MFGDPLTNPKHIPMTTIGNVCDFIGGSQPPRKEFIFKPKEGYVRLIQIRDYKTDEYVTYAPIDHCHKFCNADDIMIGRYGPPIFQILQGLEGAYNVALMKAVPHGINKEFMRAYLKRDELLHFLEGFSARTAGQAGIAMNELRSYPCPLPSTSAQEEFVDFIQQVDKSKSAVKTNTDSISD